jgi:glutathione peroxidase
MRAALSVTTLLLSTSLALLACNDQKASEGDGSAALSPGSSGAGGQGAAGAGGGTTGKAGAPSGAGGSSSGAGGGAGAKAGSAGAAAGGNTQSSGGKGGGAAGGVSAGAGGTAGPGGAGSSAGSGGSPGSAGDAGSAGATGGMGTAGTSGEAGSAGAAGAGGADTGDFVCTPGAKPGELYELSADSIEQSDPISMCEYRGKVIIVVNVASKCGYTPEYGPLQALYAKYKDQGFVVLGFPCNQFGAQEPGSDADITAFCTMQYGITFPLFTKIEVNGANESPIYTWLKAQPGGAGDIPWNFTKFLIGRDGKLIHRIPTETYPDNPAVVAEIEAALAAPAP